MTSGRSKGTVNIGWVVQNHKNFQLWKPKWKLTSKGGARTSKTKYFTEVLAYHITQASILVTMYAFSLHQRRFFDEAETVELNNQNVAL